MGKALEALKREKQQAREAQDEAPKRGVIFYLPRSLEARFKAVVGKGKASYYVRQLIEDFLAEAEREGLVEGERKARKAGKQ